MVINGYSYYDSDCPPINLGGIPLHANQWHGRGGGSLSNHDDEHPNAELIRDPSGDGYGIFIVSTMNILPGEFIRVDYGQQFLKSKFSNIT